MDKVCKYCKHFNDMKKIDERCSITDRLVKGDSPACGGFEPEISVICPACGEVFSLQQIEEDE